MTSDSNSNFISSKDTTDLISEIRCEVEITNDPSTETNEDFDEPDTILSILFKNGKLAASYFKISAKILYVLDEMSDLQPDLITMRCLLNEVNPRHIITMGKMNDDFIKTLIDTISDNTNSTNASTIEQRLVPNNLSILSFKEYSYNSCEYYVKSLRLLSEPVNMSEEERDIYLNSLINFQSRSSIHVLGTLIKFTEKSWGHFNKSNDNQLVFFHINQVALVDRVFVDKNTFNALQIFKQTAHDASFKHGKLSTTREGVSIFRLFSQHCKTTIGCLKLKKLLANPISNESELNKRLDFIKCALVPNNQTFFKSLQDTIREVSDVTVVLGRIQHSRGTSKDWETLYKTIYNILHLNELCGTQKLESAILLDFTNSISQHLYGLERCIDNTLDFKSATKNNRPSIKSGLDITLDKNKVICNNIGANVTLAAKMSIHQLPNYLDECTVIYIPDMGYVVAVAKWKNNCDKNDLSKFGFQFMFELNDNYHYKSSLCQELDLYLGDIQKQILDHENRIIERVASFVLRYNKYIREPMEIIALIDCLISMATVALERGYTQPKFNHDNIIEIKGGRHPLLELSNSYVINDYSSGGDYSHIKIVTGPNSSGKSVYLKQTAIIVYMSHVGSFIPATSANIGLVCSIHSRLHATESASLKLSSFMLDLTQVSQALYNAKPSSMILIDEFGRGTTGIEGTALLVGALTKFLKQTSNCPHIMVSTHLKLNCDLLVNNPLILYQQMEHTRNLTTSEIVFLFKIVEGFSSSYAIEIAESIELDKDVVARAKTIMTQDINYITQIGKPNDINSDILIHLSIPNQDIP